MKTVYRKDYEKYIESTLKNELKVSDVKFDWGNLFVSVTATPTRAVWNLWEAKRLQSMWQKLGKGEKWLVPDIQNIHVGYDGNVHFQIYLHSADRLNGLLIS